MWSGRIVPLLSQERIVTLSAHTTGANFTPNESRRPKSGNAYEWLGDAVDFENMLLPLPIDVSAATGVRNGSSVYVSWWTNDPTSPQEDGTFGEDIAACVMVSPFPFVLLSHEMLQLVVRLRHKKGALYNSIVTHAVREGAQIVQLEGMSTGSESTLIQFPTAQDLFEKMKITPDQASDAEMETIRQLTDIERWERMYRFLKKVEEARTLNPQPLLLDWYAKVPREFDKWLVKMHHDSLVSAARILKTQDHKTNVGKAKEALEQADGYYAIWHRVFRFGLLEDLVKGIDDKMEDNISLALRRNWADHFANSSAKSKQEPLLDQIERLIQKSDERMKLSKKEDTKQLANQRGVSRPYGFMHYVKETVTDEMCRIPFGRILREYWNKIETTLEKEKSQILDSPTKNRPSKEALLLPTKKEQIELIKEEFIRHSIPRYALLAREPDMPVIMAMIPRRQLFHMTMPLRSSTMLHQTPGYGVLDTILKVFEDRGINIWHSSLFPTSMDFERFKGSGDYTSSFVKAELRIVAAFQSEWLNRDEKALKMAFHDIEDSICDIRLAPRIRSHSRIRPEKEIQDLLIQEGEKYGFDPAEILNDLTLDDIFHSESSFANCVSQIDKNKDSLSPFRTGKDLEIDSDQTKFNRLMNWIEATKHRGGEPIVRDKNEVVLGAPPLLRVFFSHSASPSIEEQGYIDDVREILSRYSMSVFEGKYLSGHTIDQASRGRIRQCTMLVSLFWPREDFMDKNGHYLPADWIAHEESFALGLGLSIYRIIESSVRTPRYEEGRGAQVFTRGDPTSWKVACEKMNAEVKNYLFDEYRRLSYWTTS